MDKINKVFSDQYLNTTLDLGDYFPSEVDEFIITTRTDLMVSTIIEQIYDIDQSLEMTDVLSSLKERFNFSLLVNQGNTEILTEIKTSMMDVYTTIFQELMCTRMDISEEAFEKYYYALNDIQSITESSYEFFILKRYQYIFNFFKNMIESEKSSFIKSYKSEIDKKDIETYVNRKKMISFDNVVLIMSMQNIVEDIINTDFTCISDDPFDFLVAGCEGDYVVSRMKEYIGEVFIQDFIRKFISPLDKNSTKFKLISDLSVYFTEANTTTDSE